MTIVSKEKIQIKIDPIPLAPRIKINNPVKMNQKILKLFDDLPS